jgi:hypothetical protein
MSTRSSPKKRKAAGQIKFWTGAKLSSIFSSQISLHTCSVHRLMRPINSGAYQFVAIILPIRRMSRERKKMRYYCYLANLKIGIQSRHVPLFDYVTF